MGVDAGTAVDATATAADGDYRRAPAAGPRRAPRGELVDRGIGFLVGGAAPFAFAIQGGGYDVVAYEFTGLVIWWLIAAGLALGLLPRARPPRTMRLPLLGLVALIAWTAMSLIWTSSQEATFNELARLVVYAGVATLALSTLHRGNLRAAAAGLTTAAVAVVLLALASRLDPDLFSGTSAVLVIQGRLSYPLGYWNALGAWSAMTLALTLGWSAHRAAPIGRRLALGVTPAIGLAIYLTYSRGALGGLVLSLVVLYLYAGDRRELATNAALAIIGGVGAIVITKTQPAIANASGGQGGAVVLIALIALGVMVVAFADALARRRIGLVPWSRPALVAVACASLALVVGARVFTPGPLPVSAGKTQSTKQAPATRDPAARVASLHSSRYIMWRQALDAFESNPALGIGPGTFSFWWAEHEGNPPLLDPHSLYLGTLAELGLPGLLALGAIIVGVLAAAFYAARGVRRGRSIVVGLGAAVLVFFGQAAVDWLWRVPACVALVAGAAIVVIAMRSGPPPPRLEARRKSGLVVAALAAGALMIPGVVSTQLARDSTSLALAGQSSKAIDYANAAVRAEPWSATAHTALATAQLAAGHLRAAQDAAQGLIDLEPDDFVHRLLLGTIQFKEGDDAAALATFREGAVLDSKDPAAVSRATVRKGAERILSGF